MPQETEKMRMVLDRLKYLVRDYCMLAAASEFLKEEEKAKTKLAKKLLGAFLNEYPESEIAELLQELSSIANELSFFESFYKEPETIEWEIEREEQKAYLEATRYEIEFPDPWL